MKKIIFIFGVFLLLFACTNQSVVYEPVAVPEPVDTPEIEASTVHLNFEPVTSGQKNSLVSPLGKNNLFAAYDIATKQVQELFPTIGNYNCIHSNQVASALTK